MYGSVFTIWLGSKPVVVISGYQALKEAMVLQGEEFSGRANYPLIMRVTSGYGVLVSSGKQWRELRRFSLTTLKNFGMGRKTMEEKVQEEARNLTEVFRQFGDSPFNPKDLIFRAVNNVICSVVFGHRCEYDDPEFQLLIQAVESYFDVLNSTIGQLYNIFPKIFGWVPGKHQEMFAVLDRAKAFILEEVECRTKDLDPSSPQDFIEAFLIKMNEEKDKHDTDFHLKNLQTTVWNLFGAGTETTSSTLRHGLLLLMKYPHVQERVQREIDEVIGPDRSPRMDDRQNMPYTDAVIHEIQRTMDLAPTSVPHKVLKDTEFKNYLIPEGTMVLPLLSSVLSDPELWKNPDHFDPENFLDAEGRFQKNDAFVVFGMGKRVCLGEGLARMELFLFLTSLLQHFTFKGTQAPEEIDCTPAVCSFGRVPRTYDCHVQLRGK
ncbi:cytochrome P450 2M1 isoform X2 [Chanos chanos]|nr:cytochrome P450 2M1-like isoform X2 [Chanos chanos]